MDPARSSAFSAAPAALRRLWVMAFMLAVCIGLTSACAEDDGLRYFGEAQGESHRDEATAISFAREAARDEASEQCPGKAPRLREARCRVEQPLTLHICSVRWSVSCGLGPL